MTEEAKRTAVPSKPKLEKRRKSLTIRLPDDVRSELEASAVKYGRSLSEELETRLVISLAQKTQLKHEWGDDYFYIAGKTAAALSHIEDSYGRKWHESEEATEVFKKTAAQIIQNTRDHFARIERDRLEGAVTNLISLPVDEQAELFARLGGSAPPRKRRKPVEDGSPADN